MFYFWVNNFLFSEKNISEFDTERYVSTCADRVEKVELRIVELYNSKWSPEKEEMFREWLEQSSQLK